MIANGPSMVTGQIVMSPVEMAPNMPQEQLHETQRLEAQNVKKKTIQDLERVIVAHAQVKITSRAKFNRSRKGNSKPCHLYVYKST